MIDEIDAPARGRTEHPDAFMAQAFGVIVWGAIFIIGVLTAALAWGVNYAYYLGLLSAGAAYVCFAAQIARVKSLAYAAMVISVFSAAFAALLLIQGH